LAGGCFWGMQDLIRRYKGVISTRVGYTGGTVANATYRNHDGPCRSDRDHLRPVADHLPQAAGTLLPDPRSLDPEPPGQRSGNKLSLGDSSTRPTSRSGSPWIRSPAVDASGLWPGKVVTEVTPAGELLASRTGAPGLSRTLSRRLHLPLRSPGMEAPGAGESGPGELNDRSVVSGAFGQRRMLQARMAIWPMTR